MLPKKKKENKNITNESWALDSVSMATIAMVASQSRSSAVWRSESWRDIWTMVKWQTSLSNPKNIPHIFQPKTINLLTKYRVSLAFKMRYRKWGEKRRFEYVSLYWKTIHPHWCLPHDYCANSQHISLSYALLPELSPPFLLHWNMIVFISVTLTLFPVPPTLVSPLLPRFLVHALLDFYQKSEVIQSK